LIKCASQVLPERIVPDLNDYILPYPIFEFFHRGLGQMVRVAEVAVVDPVIQLVLLPRLPAGDPCPLFVFIADFAAS